MRYCIVGAGAIGAYVGASLARGGADVAVVARGPHLAAMQEHGIAVRSERGDFRAVVRASNDCAEIGPVDVVVIALKAHQIAPMLPAIAALQGPQTRVMGMQNGVPWWYFQRLRGQYEDRVLATVDPGGVLARAFDPDRTVGCVTYSATEIEAPGVIRHVEGTRYSLGRPDGAEDPVLDRIAADFMAGGLKAPVERNLRVEVWIKLLGNASLNPISALTRATLGAMTTDPLVETLIRQVMTECVDVARALGVELPISVEKRLDGARRVGEHKSSMLQDVEAGRPLELDPVVGAVVELGELTGVPVPATRHVYALAKMLDRTLAAARAQPVTAR